MDSNHDHEDIELNIENQTITDNLQPYAVNVNRLRRNPLNISFLPNNDFNLAVNSIEREASMV